MVKKAVVVGGSNGMGLAIGVELLRRGYFLEIVDLISPNEDELGVGKELYNYTYTDLLYFDEELFTKLSQDRDVEVLVITAGIGRIADFQFYHVSEIDKTFTIDTVSLIKIIRLFYDRIHSKDFFYTGVMGSIAGWMSSPSAAIYAAAKAGLIRLIESVNIELEMAGSPNRILDISPSSFKGSRFYGGKNNISLLFDLAHNIVDHIFDRETRFIPQYEEIFRGVLQRYNNDSHEYGVHSYKYKESSGRKDNCHRAKIGYFGGDFTDFNSRKVNLLREAKKSCDYLIVGIRDDRLKNTDKAPVSFEEVKKVVEACKYVDKVVDGMLSLTEIWNQCHFNRIFIESSYTDLSPGLMYEEYNACK